MKLNLSPSSEIYSVENKRREGFLEENKKLKDAQSGFQSEIDRLRSENQRIASLSDELEQTRRDSERQIQDLRRSFKSQLEAIASNLDGKK